MQLITAYIMMKALTFLPKNNKIILFNNSSNHYLLQILLINISNNNKTNNNQISNFRIFQEENYVKEI